MAIFIPGKQWEKEKKSKYKAQPQRYNGVFFASKRELKRWKELEILQNIGEIKDLKRQVAFPFYIGDDIIFKYFADFVFIWTSSGEKIIEDSKGVITPVYSLKKKIIEASYNIKITES